MKVALMPDEEWEDFKDKVLEKYGLSESDLRLYRAVFFGALATASNFFDDLMRSDMSPQEKQQRYLDWMEDLQREIDGFAVELLSSLGGVNGRNN